MRENVKLINKIKSVSMTNKDTSARVAYGMTRNKI